MPATPPLTDDQEKAVEKRIDQEIVRALRIAKITVHVNAPMFRDVLDPDLPDNNTVATMEMQEPHNRVEVRASSKDPSLQSVHIKPGGASLRFKIVSDTAKEKYFPLGIAFVRIKGESPADANGDRIGRLNFDQSQIRPVREFLYVTDSFKDAEVDDKFKFSIIIQRQSDGAIGIIDPGIEHEH